MRQNINSVSKFIQTEWQKEVSKERTHHFNEIFNEIVKDYIFKIPEKMEQEKDLQIKEKLLELQIHLADCLCYEQLEKKRVLLFLKIRECMSMNYLMICPSSHLKLNKIF